MAICALAMMAIYSFCSFLPLPNLVRMESDPVQF